MKFVSHFDKFFDMLNVSNLITGKHKRKDYQLPYKSATDTRLDVSYSCYSYPSNELVKIAVASEHFLEVY